MKKTLLAVLVISLFVGCTKRHELGNVLRVAIREKYKSLDPAFAQDYYSGIEVKRVYEGLYQYHYLKRPYELITELAEALPEIDKTGTIYTIRLKKNVRFQDDSCFPSGKGRQFVAEDVVYSFKRLADPKLAPSGWWILDDRVKGLNEWREKNTKGLFTDYDLPVVGLKAVDAHTLRIELTKPCPFFPQLLAMPYASIVPREAVEKYRNDFANHPVGTGAFFLKFLSKNQLIWDKNPTFHGESYPTDGEPEDKKNGLLADAGKPLPFVDRIIDDIIIEDQPAWLNFMQGNHDYLMTLPKDNEGSVFNSDKKPKKELLDKKISVSVTPALEFGYIVFNNEIPIFSGEKGRQLRKAISLAYDESPLISTFYFGLATKAQSPVPPGVWGYDPAYKNPNRIYNLVKAREILEKIGHPGGAGLPEIEYDTNSQPNQRLLAEYFQKSMALLGLKVKVQIWSWPEFLARIRKRQSQVVFINWLLDYPDAENVYQLMYSKNASPGTNYANYKNPKFDKIYEEFSQIQNGPKRKELLIKMRKIYEEDLPFFATLHRPETRVYHDWTKNLKIHSFEHSIEKYLRIDIEARTKAQQ
ncbi:MAG: ABC transporter substrate-binding protein [Bacteriovoracia bacterium]